MCFLNFALLLIWYVFIKALDKLIFFYKSFNFLWFNVYNYKVEWVGCFGDYYDALDPSGLLCRVWSVTVSTVNPWPWPDCCTLDLNYTCGFLLFLQRPSSSVLPICPPTLVFTPPPQVIITTTPQVAASATLLDQVSQHQYFGSNCKLQQCKRKYVLWKNLFWFLVIVLLGLY